MNLAAERSQTGGRFAWGTVFCLLVWAVTANAGEHEANPDSVRALTVGSHTVHTVTEAERTWATSLVAQLEKRRGGKVALAREFLVTDLPACINDSCFVGRVFVDAADTNRYLVLQTNDWGALVDFANEKVFHPCCGGLSYHLHESGRFLLLIHPVAKELSGIAVDERRNPRFKPGRAVRWY